MNSTNYSDLLLRSLSHLDALQERLEELNTSTKEFVETSTERLKSDKELSEEEVYDYYYNNYLTLLLQTDITKAVFKLKTLFELSVAFDLSSAIEEKTLNRIQLIAQSNNYVYGYRGGKLQSTVSGMEELIKQKIEEQEIYSVQAFVDSLNQSNVQK